VLKLGREDGMDGGSSPGSLGHQSSWSKANKHDRDATSGIKTIKTKTRMPTEKARREEDDKEDEDAD